MKKIKLLQKHREFSVNDVVVVPKARAEALVAAGIAEAVVVERAVKTKRSRAIGQGQL